MFNFIDVFKDFCPEDLVFNMLFESLNVWLEVKVLYFFEQGSFKQFLDWRSGQRVGVKSLADDLMQFGQNPNLLLEVNQFLAKHNFQRISESLESLPLLDIELKVFVELKIAKKELTLIKFNYFLHVEKPEFELGGKLCHIENLIQVVIDVAWLEECEQLSEVGMRLVAPYELVQNAAEDPGVAFWRDFNHIVLNDLGDCVGWFQIKNLRVDDLWDFSVGVNSPRIQYLINDDADVLVEVWES